MPQSRQEIVAWVGRHILPHEAALRAWLKRSGTAAHEIDDIVQEAYCRLAALGGVAHITNGRAYLFQTARNVVLEQIRRARIVRIDSMTEVEALSISDSEPSPEQVAGDRRELHRVQELIEGLPDRCRRIFELRRIHGLPQREIARLLGVSENVVEMQTMRGLRLILAALEHEGGAPRHRTAKPNERARARERD